MTQRKLVPIGLGRGTRYAARLGQWSWTGTSGKSPDGCDLMLFHYVGREGHRAIWSSVLWAVAHVERDGILGATKYYASFDEAADHIDTGLPRMPRE